MILNKNCLSVSRVRKTGIFFFFSENTIFTLNHCLLWDLCAETLTSARNVEKLFQWQNIFDTNFLLTPNVKTNHLQPTTKTANPSFHLKNVSLSHLDKEELRKSVK